MKKNLFDINLNNSSDTSGSHAGQITCEPCSSECEKINKRINKRKLEEIKTEEVPHLLKVFNF